MSLDRNTSLRTLVDLKDWISGGFMKPGMILIGGTFLVAAQRSFGSMEFAGKSLGLDAGFQVPLYMFWTAFLVFGAVPLVAIMLFGRIPLREYGEASRAELPSE